MRLLFQLPHARVKHDFSSNTVGFFEKPFHWVNYLSGIAVIVDEAGGVTALAVRGDDIGWMVPSEEIIEE